MEMLKLETCEVDPEQILGEKRDKVYNEGTN